MKRLKNKTAYGYKLNKMNDDTYALRRKVIDTIYEVKGKGFSIPRIEVRIVKEGQSNIMGYAYMNSNIVHIAEKWAKVKNDRLTHLVLHEILHAIKGIEHDEKCYLMQSFIPNEIEINKTWKAFNKYFN